MADSHHEEDVLGKAYDARLMRRLLTYLRPYRWQTALALGSIILKAGADVMGPILTMVAIDLYLSGPVNRTDQTYRFAYTFFSQRLSHDPFTGINQIAIIFVGLLVFSFLLEY